MKRMIISTIIAIATALMATLFVNRFTKGRQKVKETS